MGCFKERVADFWQWFTDNEAQCAEYLSRPDEYDPEEVADFLGRGLNLAVEDILFSPGDDFEIILSPEGSRPLFFLTSYLTAARPPGLAGWRFSPWKPPDPGSRLRLDDLELMPASVRVAVGHEEETDAFFLIFHHPHLSAMDESEACHVFYLLLDMVLGENIALNHIAGVEMAEDGEGEMIPLTELPLLMREALELEGREFLVNPCEQSSAYGLEPGKDDSRRLRFDILTGFTSLPELLDDFYEDRDYPSLELLEENGVRAAYLAYDLRHPEDGGEEMELRYEIAERLEKEILGPPGSGLEIGRVIGQAAGVSRAYIDLLLYDAEAFVASAALVLADYGYAFSLYRFHRQAQPEALPGAGRLNS